MRLSEAIRLGSMLGPQVFGHAFGSREGACALGAAILAADCPIFPGVGANIARASDTGGMARVPDAWVPMLQSQQACPHCPMSDKGYRLIAHLNDTHRWTRERIADWVESIERSLEAGEAVETSDARSPEVSAVPVSEIA